MIHASGTLAGKFNRKQTGVFDWDAAGSLVASWKTWEGELPAPVPEIQTPGKITIERCVKAFLMAHSESSAVSTQRMYRYMMKQFVSYSAAKGYVLIEQWSPIDVREFRASWNVASNTATKNMTMMKAFFEFALSNEWIDRNPARLVKEVKGR